MPYRLMLVKAVMPLLMWKSRQQSRTLIRKVTRLQSVQDMTTARPIVGIRESARVIALTLQTMIMMGSATRMASVIPMISMKAALAMMPLPNKIAPDMPKEVAANTKRA